MGKARNAFSQFCSFVMMGVESLASPTDIVNKCFTLSAFRFSLTSDGSSSEKKEVTESSTLHLPSETAKPTAVEVKLLLNE